MIKEKNILLEDLNKKWKSKGWKKLFLIVIFMNKILPFIRKPKLSALNIEFTKTLTNGVFLELI